MSDVKWTKGPWIAFGSIPEEGVDCFWIKAQPHPAMRGFTKDIGTVDGYQDDPERSANAHLIASAPELYEALKAIVNKTSRGLDLGMKVSDLWDEIIDAEAALAKARGETQ